MSIRAIANKIKPYKCTTLIAVLENPKTIENIGSTLRNVNAFGVQKLYIIDGYNMFQGKTWDEFRFNNKLSKLSVSAIKWTYTKLFSNTQECINYLNKNNYTSIVTSPHIKGRNNVILEDGVYTQKKLAVWFGNESIGISELAVNNSIQCINIPMYGIIESLNLGTTTGIVLYEITKQRRKFKQKNEE